MWVTVTSLRLSSGQNPYKRLGSQCGFLSDASLCLQHCPLVQKALLAQRIPLHHAGYDSHDFLVLPAKLTQKGSQNILTLPHDYHYRQQFEMALQKIDRLHFL